MGGLRAYAVAVAQLVGVAGATGAERVRFRGVVERELAPPPVAVRDRLGPIHRRVPGTPLAAPDDPTPADLETLLDGGPVPPARAAATWRLVAALASGLAAGSTSLADDDLPPGLLGPLDLPVPAVERYVAGWCPVAAARAVPGLRTWASTLDPGLDVVVLGPVGAGP